MSKKGKLILATAVFGTALFAASCGGGGGGGTTAGTGTGGGGGGGGGGTPSPTEQGRVLALLNVGTASAGTLNPVTICQLKSDNKAYCGNDLNPNANVDLQYVHEFPNGNVVLKDSYGKLYFFDGSQVKKLTTYRRLGGTSDINEPAGIAIPSGATYYATPNFVIMYDSSGKKLVAVSKDGKVIKEDSGVTSVKASCEVATKGTDYKLNPDGSSSSTTIPTLLTSAGGKYLVQDASNNIYLSDSKCSASGVLVATLSSAANDAKMVKVGNDFYIAVRTNASSENLKYYKVSGTTITDFTSTSTITLASSANEYYYALDGNGRLYVITNDSSRPLKVYNTDGTLAYGTNVSVNGLLGLADRALAKDSSSSEVYEITVTGHKNTGSTLFPVVDKCTDSGTKSIKGAGTNFVRCAHNNGLYILTFNSGDGTYSRAFDTSFTISDVKWATNKVLVKPSSGPIKLCNTNVGAISISCSDTDLPTLDLSTLDPTGTSSDKYLKVNGNDVFYTSGSVLKVGNIFDPPSVLPITLSSPSRPSGGNASFDLNRFAFSFGPDFCRNQIIYFSSRTASPKTYTIAQPSNACVARILKVY